MAELPTPEDLERDRPQLVGADAGGLGCLRTLAVLALTAWLALHPLVPAVAPPAGPWAELLPLLAGVLAALGMFTPAAGFTASTTYALIAEVRATSTLAVQWWRALLVLAWAPALLLLVAGRLAALAAGAPALGPWWSALGGLVAGFGTLMTLAALAERHGVFLHPAGIHAGPLHFHPWARVVRIRTGGPFLALDLDRERSHPPVWLALDAKARGLLLDEARRRQVPVVEGLPAMWPGKLAALATAGGAAWGAWRLQAGGLPWPAALLAVAGVAVAIGLLQERLTGISGLMRNRLRLKPPAASAGALDVEAFTARFEQELHRRQPGRTVERLAPLRLRSRPAGDAAAEWCEHRLDNAWGLYQADPGRLDAVMAEFAAGAAEAAALGAVDPARVIAAVRHRDLLAELPGGGAGDAQPLHRVLAGELIEVLAEDLPHSVRYLNRGDLAALGMDEEALWARARANLPRQVAERTVEGRDGFYLVRVPWHAGSVLRDAAWFTDMRFPVQGRWLVALPHRDLALVSGDGEPDALARLRTAAGAEHGGPGSLTTQVFRIARDGSWAVVEG